MIWLGVLVVVYYIHHDSKCKDLLVYKKCVVVLLHQSEASYAKWAVGTIKPLDATTECP